MTDSSVTMNAICSNKRCESVGKHIYDGHALCDKHLMITKSKEPCSICFEKMTRESERIQLTCGHFFHTECLGCSKAATCPYCRGEITPGECFKVFQESQIKPLMMKVFALPQPHMVIGVMDRLVKVLERICDDGWGEEEWKLDVVKDMMVWMEKYHRTSIQIGESPKSMFEEVIELLMTLRMHMSEYGTLDGFNVNGEGGMLMTSSTVPVEFSALE